MAFSKMFSLCLLVSSVLANPIQIRSSSISLSLAVKINLSGGSQALINRDRERSRAIIAHAQAKAQGQLLDHVPVPVVDAAVTYTASIGVGEGTYSLIVDTGSANTWIGAGKPYIPGPNSRDTGNTVKVRYGSGNFSGEEFTDDVKLGSATIRSQSLGVASTSSGFSSFDGILGIGPVDLTSKTTSNGGTVPTVTDNLVSQGVIEKETIGISFVPTTSLNELNGELDFGKIDSSKFRGDITYVPITNTSPANKFWGIDQSITYGPSGIPILDATAGIVDTGTTLVLIATSAFQAYQKAIGATLDQATGLLTVANPSSLQSLFFCIGDRSFELTADAQMWPRALNSQIGGAANQTYLIVSDLGPFNVPGLQFINGFTFLQRFYSVFDTTNSRVGLATTSHTYDTTN